MQRYSAPLSEEVIWYLESRNYDTSGMIEPAIRVREPDYVKGAIFDPARVDRVVAALHMLRHTQGKWAGRPLDPDPWQVGYIIAPVFGWVAPNEDGDLVRIIRKCIVDVSRKSGKTTLACGLALYLAFADKEAGAQVLAVAGSKDQAGNAYRPAKLIAESSPEFRAAGIKPLQTQIVSPDGSFFKAVASVGDLIHGSNVHAAIVDELHVHKNGSVLEAVETGTVSRTQPLTLIITTADDGRQESVYAQQRKLLESAANGSANMPELYGCVWAADPEDDPFAEETWRKANPGYGISVSPAYMKKAAAEAKESPISLASFQRLHLGMRTKQETKYIEMPKWNRNASIVEESKLQGREAYGGLDLASTSDLTAFTLLFPDDKRGGFDALFRIFAPEGAIAALDKRTHGAASTWVASGVIKTTPGDVIDYDHVKSQILADMEAFDIREVNFDRWNSSMLVNELVAEGVPLVAFGQGFASMSAPTKELGRLISEGTAERPMLRHGGNPCARWQVDNLAVTQDDAGNLKPSKKNSGDKIDSVVALIMALDRAMQRKPKRRSAYEDDDFSLFA
jgi:phage terminase large subunit-like protein